MASHAGLLAPDVREAEGSWQKGLGKQMGPDRGRAPQAKNVNKKISKYLGEMEREVGEGGGEGNVLDFQHLEGSPLPYLLHTRTHPWGLPSQCGGSWEGWLLDWGRGCHH